MWYKKTSVEDTVNKLAKKIIITKIRKYYLMKFYRFPTRYELDNTLKRVNNHIKNNHGSVYKERRDSMERKIERIVNNILDNIQNLYA